MPEEHVHTYRRHRKQRELYFCTAPNCYHKTEREFLRGKISLCPTCGREMILGYEELRRAVPRCTMCRNDKKSENMRKALSAVIQIAEPVELTE